MKQREGGVGGGGGRGWYGVVRKDREYVKSHRRRYSHLKL